jgi:RimJ/RimL family protein N-acetyltransferase
VESSLQESDRTEYPGETGQEIETPESTELKMGKPAAHFCVTREHLTLPPNIERVRWIGESDLPAMREPFYEGQGEIEWTLEHWRKLADEGYRYCGVFEESRLCALAGVWERFSDAWEVISVITKDGYRQRGLGKAVVAFAADHILDHVDVALYTTGTGNTASIRTAESVGFERCTNLAGCEKWCMWNPRPEVVGRRCPLLP